MKFDFVDTHNKILPNTVVMDLAAGTSGMWRIIWDGEILAEPQFFYRDQAEEFLVQKMAEAALLPPVGEKILIGM